MCNRCNVKTSQVWRMAEKDARNHSAGRSRRQLFPPADQPEQEVRLCTLCHSHHSQLSSPCTWKSEQAQLLAKSLSVELHKPICRPCRDDISRLLRNPEHQPRWKKQGNTSCCLPGCSEPVFAHSRVASGDQLHSIAHTIGCSPLSVQNIPIPAPLCKVHYHLIYNVLQPTQINCPTCGLDLRKSTVRSCPDPQRFQQYLAENTGFEGELTEGAKVCFTCYKSQLHMLKGAKLVSTDGDLLDLISALKTSLPPIEKVGSVSDVINRAMAQASIHVAEILLQQEAILLPAVHTYFSARSTESMNAANLQFVGGVKEHVTTRWVLSNLVVSLGHHLSYACRIRKYGTLLYRTDGDILNSLTVSLHKLSSSTKHASAGKPPSYFSKKQHR